MTRPSRPTAEGGTLCAPPESCLGSVPNARRLNGVTANRRCSVTRGDAQLGRDPPPAGGRVVQPGESLWSIAADRLRADATLAEIARTVSRLWEPSSCPTPSCGCPDFLPTPSPTLSGGHAYT